MEMSDLRAPLVLSKQPQTFNRRRIPVLVRLETLGAVATRSLLYCTYFVLIVAAVLTIVLHFKFDTGTVELASPPCTKTPGLPGSPISQGACVSSDPSSPPNGTVWSGLIVDMNSLAGDVSLTAEITNPTPEATSQVSEVVVSAVIQGSTGGLDDKDFQDLFSNLNSSVTIQCTDSDGCQPITVVDSFTSTQGQGGGGFSVYRCIAHYNDALSRYGTVTYTFRYRLAGFRLADVIVRVCLIITTVIVAIRFSLSSFRDGTPFKQWLPQRKWIVCVLLVSLVLWQNPLLAATQMLSSVPYQVRIATAACGGVGWAGIFVFWLMIMDSFKYGPSALPPHFYTWKLLFGAFFALSFFAMQLLRDAGPLFFHNTHLTDTESSQILLGSLICGAVFALNLLVWFIWFLVTVSRTRTVLTALPYAATRFQQLCFRFLVYQQTVVVLFVITIDSIPLFQFFVSYIRQPNVPHQGQHLSKEEWVADLLQNLVAGFQPIGELLLISVYSYFMALCLLPPKPSPGVLIHGKTQKDVEAGDDNDDGDAGEGVERERSRSLFAPIAGMVDAVSTVLGITSDGSEFGFNLVTASWLFDFAWAVYFDPPGETTASSFGPLRYPPHNFTLDAFLHDATTDTVAMVFRLGNRVVVTFRGTASKKNFMTDLKVSRGTVEFGNDRHNMMGMLPGVREALPLLHSGFWRAYQSIRPALQDAVRTSLIEAGVQSRIFTTGHSLGGALATIASFDLKPLVEDNRSAHGALTGQLRRPVTGRSKLGSQTTRSLRSPGMKFSRSTLRSMGSSMDEDDKDSQISDDSSWYTASPTVTTRNPHYGSGPPTTRTPSVGVKSSKDGANLAEGWWTESDDDSPEYRRKQKPRSAVAPEEVDASQIVAAGAGAGAGAGEPRSRAESEDGAGVGSHSDPGVGIVPSRLDGGQGSAFRPNYDIVMYTYGQPRVGNSTFARQFDKAIPYAYRVVFDGDIIAGIPKFLWAYKHVGTEVVLDALGNLIVDPSFVESKLRNRSKRSFVAHAMGSYREGLLSARRLENLPLAPPPSEAGVVASVEETGDDGNTPATGSKSSGSREERKLDERRRGRTERDRRRR